MSSNQIADGVYRVSSSALRLRDGAWSPDQSEQLYLVGDESKLADITDATPGAIACTAGCAKVWQLGTDGATWVPGGWYGGSGNIAASIAMVMASQKVMTGQSQSNP